MSPVSSEAHKTHVPITADPLALVFLPVQALVFLVYTWYVPRLSQTLDPTYLIFPFPGCPWCLVVSKSFLEEEAILGFTESPLPVLSVRMQG